MVVVSQKGLWHSCPALTSVQFCVCHSPRYKSRGLNDPTQMIQLPFSVSKETQTNVFECAQRRKKLSSPSSGVMSNGPPTWMASWCHLTSRVDGPRKVTKLFVCQHGPTPKSFKSIQGVSFPLSPSGFTSCTDLNAYLEKLVQPQESSRSGRELPLNP